MSTPRRLIETKHMTDMSRVLRCPSYLGVATAWIDEDGDAIAITTDLRRGLAAIHAQARHDFGGPASLVDVSQRWVRFVYPPDSDEWLMRGCDATAADAVAVVVAHEVAPVEVAIRRVRGQERTSR